MSTQAPPILSHGGIIFQLDMFRPTSLAAVLAEGLISKARNILTSSLEIARHPTAPIAVARIVGPILDDDAAEFWRDNTDIAIYASQVLPRQAFIYYARSGPQRREGLMVVQRGQVAMANDATIDSLPAGQPWPVERLCEQMRVTLEDLAEAFPGGPRVTISLGEPQGDDQRLLLVLAGQPDEADLGDDPQGEEHVGPTEPAPPPPAGPRASAPQQARPAAARPAAAAGRPGATAASAAFEEDAKRRATERAAEVEAQRARAAEVTTHLAYTFDERGLVVAPSAELGEADLLAPYHQPSFHGNLPDGLPERIRGQLEGKPIDFAVRVEFLSEVFANGKPLNRADFDANATDLELGGRALRVLDVFAPRLGAGRLLRAGAANVYITRRAGEPLPAELILQLLDRG
jgi:hypothetical protein